MIDDRNMMWDIENQDMPWIMPYQDGSGLLAHTIWIWRWTSWKAPTILLRKAQCNDWPYPNLRQGQRLRFWPTMINSLEISLFMIHTYSYIPRNPSASVSLQMWVQTSPIPKKYQKMMIYLNQPLDHSGRLVSEPKLPRTFVSPCSTCQVASGGRLAQTSYLVDVSPKLRSFAWPKYAKIMIKHDKTPSFWW